jgi:hypothetical protein
MSGIKQKTRAKFPMKSSLGQKQLHTKKILEILGLIVFF